MCLIWKWGRWTIATTEYTDTNASDVRVSFGALPTPRLLAVWETEPCLCTRNHGTDASN